MPKVIGLVACVTGRGMSWCMHLAHPHHKEGTCVALWGSGVFCEDIPLSHVLLCDLMTAVSSLFLIILDATWLYSVCSFPVFAPQT